MEDNTKENMSTITISGKEIPIKHIEIEHTLLKFYPENPRIYSLLGVDGAIPGQSDIEDKLGQMDHVNGLVQSIKANGGLIDPLIVRDGDFVVFEGNSRLAAYRKLAKKNPVKWANVKCNLLPADIDESLIFILLGQYHIISRKDWDPYEKAGYLYRRHKYYGVSVKVMASEMGLSEGETKTLVNVYEFMVDNDDRDSKKWSYYLELLKSRSIKKVREKIPDFTDVVVKQIKNGTINNAMDIRTKLEPVTKLNGKKGEKIIKDFVNGNKSLNSCYEIACQHGVTNNTLQRLTKFKEFIADSDVRKEILAMDEESQKKCKYELKKIKTSIESLILPVFESSDNNKKVSI